MARGHCIRRRPGAHRRCGGNSPRPPALGPQCLWWGKAGGHLLWGTLAACPVQGRLELGPCPGVSPSASWGSQGNRPSPRRTCFRTALCLAGFVLSGWCPLRCPCAVSVGGRPGTPLSSLGGCRGAVQRALPTPKGGPRGDTRAELRGPS